ncbi:MAG: histidinol-phosphatase HisJ family protein [Solirubrobacterales bacterium]
MLTDYHLHLRPDDLDAYFDDYMTPENVDRYRAVAEEAGIAELGVSEHIHRFADALRIWDHPYWQENAIDDLGRYVDFVRGETDLKLGIEMDYVAGREDRIETVLDEHEWDYVVGSVHFLAQAAIDWDKYDIWKERSSPEEIWREYFETLAAAARTGMYDIMAHPDLVKYWGKERPAPERDPRFFYEPAVEAFAEAGVAVEISTAGLRKPVGEIYPAPAFIEMCVDAGLPFALSSDAHEPMNVGHGYEQAVALLAEYGVNELAVFSGRERKLEPIG